MKLGKGIMGGVIILIFGALLSACSHDGPKGVVPPIEPTPTYIAGQASGGVTELSLDYTRTDYEAARAQGKVILLYFHANWCPTCRAQQPANDTAFAQLRNDPDVAVFVSSFNDSEETAEDKVLQREFDIPYQHTFVILNRKGEVSYKYTGQLSAEQIVAEVNKVKKQ